MLKNSNSNSPILSKIAILFGLRDRNEINNSYKFSWLITFINFNSAFISECNFNALSKIF